MLLHRRVSRPHYYYTQLWIIILVVVVLLSRYIVLNYYLNGCNFAIAQPCPCKWYCFFICFISCWLKLPCIFLFVQVYTSISYYVILFVSIYLKKIQWPKRDEVCRQLRLLCIEELCDLCSLPSIISVKNKGYDWPHSQTCDLYVEDIRCIHNFHVDAIWNNEKM
jgi:hypothetical protein